MATNYKEVHSKLRNFLDQYKKIAEDPNRTAPTEEDLKEGQSQTTEVNKGDGTKQGPAGKEMAAEVKNNSVGTGNSVEDGKTNTGKSPDDGNKATNTSPATTSTSPDEDIDKMKNVDPSIKKAYAQQYLLENSVMDVIDRYFTNKTASQQQPVKEDLEVKEAADIIRTAEAYKLAHIQGLSKALGISPKLANDILNQVADENPAAVFPPEALSDADAEALLAEAAAADAGAVAPDAVPAGAPAPVPAEDDEENDDEENDEEGDEGGEGAEGEDEAAMTQAIAAELEPVIQQLADEGFSEEEIASAILEEGGVTEEDIVDMAVGELANQGYNEDEAVQIIESLGQLQQGGATPEELAQVLNQTA